MTCKKLENFSFRKYIEQSPPMNFNDINRIRVSYYRQLYRLRKTQLVSDWLECWVQESSFKNKWKMIRATLQLWAQLWPFQSFPKSKLNFVFLFRKQKLIFAPYSVNYLKNSYLNNQHFIKLPNLCKLEINNDALLSDKLLQIFFLRDSSTFSFFFFFFFINNGVKFNFPFRYITNSLS